MVKFRGCSLTPKNGLLQESLSAVTPLMLEAGLNVKINDGAGRFVVKNHDRGGFDSQRFKSILLLLRRVIFVPLELFSFSNFSIQSHILGK